MKIATRTLALLAVLTLFCSLADARPIRGKTSVGISDGVDAGGNLVSNSTNSTLFIKAIKFPKSGVIINRRKQTNATNLSGKRQVFKNTRAGVFDPETMGILSSSRNRLTFPKGRAKKNNTATGRGIAVRNPKKIPAP